jgi:hypothetical protein
MRNKRIVLRAAQMDEVWRKWHVSNADGGHPGVRATMLRIERAYYYYGDLHAWAKAKKLQCAHCQNKLVPKFAKPPPATITSKRPNERVTIDHTEVGHVCKMTSATYASSF